MVKIIWYQCTLHAFQPLFLRFNTSSGEPDFFTRMETSPVQVKSCKFFTYARHSWSLSSKSYFACHTYCGTGHPFIKVIFEDSSLLHCWNCRNGVKLSNQSINQSEDPWISIWIKSDLYLCYRIEDLITLYCWAFSNRAVTI